MREEEQGEIQNKLVAKSEKVDPMQNHGGNLQCGQE